MRRHVDEVRADLRYALRALRRAPAFAVTAVLILALGIGATTALFSAVKGLLLDPLAVDDPDRLVRLRWTGTHAGARSMSEYGFSPETAAGERVTATFPYPIFEQFRGSNDTLSGLFAAAPIQLNLVAGDRADVADGLLVSGDYFEVLGVRAHLGRVLGPQDDERTASPVAVIGHQTWTNRFGGQADIVGSVVSVNGAPVTIVGVLPAGYAGVQEPRGDAAHVHLPLALAAQVLRDGEQRFEASWWWLQIMGRLRPGVTPQQVEGDLGGVFRSSVQATLDEAVEALGPNASEVPPRERTATARLLVDSGRRGIYDPDPDSKRQALVLGIVVGLVLLIVCTNVANLLLSRATTRRREIALRRSVGGTRARIVRQLVTEGAVLSTLGGGLGLLLAFAARGWLPFDRGAPFDGRVLVFVTVLSLSTGLAFSLVPALRATGPDTASALQEASRNVARGNSLLSSALLVLQVAVSMTLAVGAGLFLTTLANLRRVDVGFDAGNLLLFRVEPRLSGYEGERMAALYERLTENLSALPGVRSVSLSSVAFLTGSRWTSTVSVEGASEDAKPPPPAHMNTVSPEFFTTMDILLLAGRVFGDGDRVGAPAVAIVNETAAREYFGDRAAVGGRLRQGSESLEVVGVVRDVKYADLRAPAPPTVYRPHAQDVAGGRTFEVKTAVPASSLITVVRETVRRVDPNLPLITVSTQEGEIERRLTRERLLASAYSLFGGLTLLLAAIGLYGLASYRVAQRTPEIGIRMALGAQRPDIARMVMRESLLLVGIGVVVGIAGALAANRLIENLLFGLAPTDVSTIALATALIGVVAALAAYLPARRAARVDPMIALRCE